MFFKPDEIKTSNGISIDNEVLPSVCVDVLEHVFVLGKSGVILNKLFPEIAKKHSYHMPSYGNWSFNHMIAHVVSLIGACEVFLCSWTISEQPVKELLQLLDSGNITELHCLFDSRVPKQCPNAFQIVQHRFGNIRLTHIHAKIAVLINENYSVVINSSANLSRNDAIEAYVITESESIATEQAKWIKEQIEGGFPFK